jgi:hypothetical protein
LIPLLFAFLLALICALFTSVFSLAHRQKQAKKVNSYGVGEPLTRDLLRKLFETVVARGMKERLAGGEAFAVDASMIVADALPSGRGQGRGSRSSVEQRVAEYFSVLRFWSSFRKDHDLIPAAVT